MQQLTFGRSIDDEVNRIDVADDNNVVRFTDEEIVLALKFLETAPKSTTEDEVKKLIVSNIEY